MMPLILSLSPQEQITLHPPYCFTKMNRFNIEHQNHAKQYYKQQQTSFTIMVPKWAKIGYPMCKTHLPQQLTPPWPFEALPRSRVVVPISHLPQFSMATNRCSPGGSRHRCIDPCAQQMYSNVLITLLVSLLTISIRQNKHNPQMTSRFPLRSLVPTFPAASAPISYGQGALRP